MSAYLLSLGIISACGMRTASAAFISGSMLPRAIQPRQCFAPIPFLRHLPGRVRTTSIKSKQITCQDATSKRFSFLRESLAKNNLDAWLILSGSAGTALVAANGVSLEGIPGGGLLVTDGRYTIQAKSQVDPENWIVQITGANLPLTPEYVSRALGKGSKRVGVDPKTMPMQMYKELKKALGEHVLVPQPDSPLDKVWSAAGRPPPPDGPTLPHNMEYSGRSVQEKVNEVRSKLAEAGADALVVAALDEVAWLLNIRGSDISYTPVTHAYVIVTMQDLRLYIDPQKDRNKTWQIASDAMKVHLKDSDIHTNDYDSVFDDLRVLASKGTKFWVDPSATSLAIMSSVNVAQDSAKPSSAFAANVIEKRSPICLAKAIKNEVELCGMRNAHVRDGAAMARILSRLEHSVERGSGEDELSAAAIAFEERQKNKGFMTLSFTTISASGPNGAITHYAPSPATNRKLKPGEMFLLDSGGQYLDGTTDITRTVMFGTPQREHVESYTRVLKSHISLAACVFPLGTTGYQLDILARAPLWKAGMDYAHGTGHGVGAYLGVHEGPQSITFRYREDAARLEEGMTVTIEPGFYKEGDYGIRIENLMIVVRRALANQAMPGTLLCFEPLTVTPFCSKLIDAKMLNEEEISYVNAYHQRVWREVSPLLQGPNEKEVLAWLERSTSPIGNLKPAAV